MKKMMKALICAMMFTAAVAAMPAVATAKDNQDVCTCDCYTLILRDKASYNAPIIFSVDDAYGYEMDIQDYMNGFGYCYVPAFHVNGWVDLDDISYEDFYDAYDYRSYNAYDYMSYDPYDYRSYDAYDYDYRSYDAYDYMSYNAYDYNAYGYNELCFSNVQKGYLALRSYPAYTDANIIAKIYENGTELYMTGEYDGNYGYCYVPDFDMYGWVDVRYIL